MDEQPVRFVEVYRPRTAAQAHLLKNLLENEGFTVHIENELLQGLAGELPMGWASAPRLLVPDSEETPARAFLAHTHPEPSAPDSEEDSDEEQTRCLACGADLPEDEDRCPKCGWSFQDQGDAG